ncbi:MAG: hypothetical protein ABIE74_08935, partial [Pseudomonadota bacterium]
MRRISRYLILFFSLCTIGFILSCEGGGSKVDNQTLTGIAGGSNNDTKIAVDTTAPENVKVEIDIPAVNPQNFTATSLTLPLKISGED